MSVKRLIPAWIFFDFDSRADKTIDFGLGRSDFESRTDKTIDFGLVHFDFDSHTDKTVDFGLGHMDFRPFCSDSK